jgi:hypothetical protein
MNVPGVATAVPTGGEPPLTPPPPPTSMPAGSFGSSAPSTRPPSNPFTATPPQTSFPPPPPKPPTESPFSSAAASQSLNPYASPGATDAAFTQFATGSLPINPRPVSADTVFNYAWEIWKHNLGLLVAVTLIILVLNWAIVIPFTILQGVLQQQKEHEAATAAYFIGQILANLTQLYLGIGAMQINLKLARRHPAGFNDLFSGGASLFLPVLGGAIIAYVALVVGVILCIVPAILLMLAYWPFYFLIIDRKAGVLESFTIASQITKGNWASVFVLWLMSLGISILGCLALCIGIIFAGPLVSMMFAVAYLMMSGQLLPYGSYPAYMPPPQPAPQAS